MYNQFGNEGKVLGAITFINTPKKSRTAQLVTNSKHHILQTMRQGYSVYKSTGLLFSLVNWEN